MKERVLNRVLEFFLGSSDFNGILLSQLCDEMKLTRAALQTIVAELMEDETVTLAFESHSINPHIKRLPDLPLHEQLERLHKDDPSTICVYPSPKVISTTGGPSSNEARPFARRLALAEAQLTPVFFRLDVLDRYYRDPRYHFDFHDFGGSIAITSEHYESQDMDERDKVLLQTFGIGYDSKSSRVVIVYLRYLADLSPEHQQIWSAYVVTDECSMNSDYARATINGDWPIYNSAYEALLTEQAEINKLSELIGKPNLFRETLDEKRPAGFHPMLQPTRKNFDDFVHLLDKMLSENINREFFQGDIPVAHEVERKDGKIEIDRPGTLRLLEEWLSSKCRTANGEDVSKEVVTPLKEIRKLRQQPAHGLKANVYNLAYTKQQDDLVGEVVHALTRLRLILWSHPKAKERYTPPDWLDGDKIVFY
jgi:hypothetical protein